MRNLILSCLLVLFLATSVFAEYVGSYYRRDGTYVQGYYRSDSNNTVQDNYSYKGNTNPYTNETGTNYYRSSPSSQYYDSSYGYKRPSTYAGMSAGALED